MTKSRKATFKVCGFRSRKKTAQGRKILRKRRKKGRQHLTPFKK